MAAFTTIANEEPAGATIPSGLIFVFSTASLSPQKDSEHDQYHISRS